MSRTGFAPGKIILSGEYAVVFGKPGVAVPSPRGMTVRFEEGPLHEKLSIRWESIAGDDQWDMHLRHILHECEHFLGKELKGELTIQNDLPLGKGMGSSTALVIATVRCLLGEDSEKEARLLEDELNPGHSGLDFAVIWNNQPLQFRKGSDPQPIDLPLMFLEKAHLIDTGMPSDPTTTMVDWIKSREKELEQHIDEIGRCTERLLAGESPFEILRDHHRAQLGLGVVPQETQMLIDLIEHEGGSAKVIGAGSRGGGAGMVLAIHDVPAVIEDIVPLSTPSMSL